MNTGQTSSSDSNSAPEFSTDTESNLNRISGSKQRKNPPESKAEKLARKSASSYSKRMAAGSGQPQIPVSGGYDIADSLDPSTLLQLQNLQVISPNQSASREHPKGTDFLDIANRLHLAVLTQLKNEIFESNTRLNHVTAERDGLKSKLNQLSAEKQRMQKEYQERLQSQMMRVTELQSVIAELTRKLNEATGNRIIEEDEEIEESQCSSDLEAEEGFSNRSEGSNACTECSCGEAECEHRIIDAGPNQVNFLAATNDIAQEEVTSPDGIDTTISENREDQYDVLKRVIGNLESITDKKKPGEAKNEKETDVDAVVNFETTKEELAQEIRATAEEQRIGKLYLYCVEVCKQLYVMRSGDLLSEKHHVYFLTAF
ncbi:uncharacterized protein LOC135690363 isoform X2 [Rhopilema esculentum]